MSDNTKKPMIEYRRGISGEMPDMVDFANYVFSQHRPHDFKSLIPKVYADGKQTEDQHFLAVEDGRIKGLVAYYPHVYEIAGVLLDTRFIGTVSVHPYSRGQGFMKALMWKSDEAFQRDGTDLAVLSGSRQRYRYFGYEQGGYQITYYIDASNLRHTPRVIPNDLVLQKVDGRDTDRIEQIWKIYQRRTITGRGLDEFYEITQTWRASLYAVMDRMQLVGYLILSETGDTILEYGLISQTYLTDMIRAVFAGDQAAGMIHLSLGAEEQDAIRILSPLSAHASIEPNLNYKIYNYERVLSALLKLKAACFDLRDGDLVIGIGNAGVYHLQVHQKEISVTLSEESPTWILSETECVRLLTSPAWYTEGQFLYPDAPKGWFPLSFRWSQTDEF